MANATRRLASMIRLEPRETVDAETVARIKVLASLAGDRGLSDDFWLELSTGVGLGYLLFDAVELVGYAHTSIGSAVTSIQVIALPAHTEAAEAAAIQHIVSRSTQPCAWWVLDPNAAEVEIATAAGLAITRQVVQMRRSLPISDHAKLTTRAFRPGFDDEEWLGVNSRAFASHPEQGAWTHAMLHARIGEPWFRADGFLIHEIDGVMAGFCWTKIHADTSPPLGEIYVIAVDPAFHGRGLGRALTEAGLAFLHARGITTGMLYVDATNSAAIALYRSMGFETAHVNMLFA